MLRPNQTSKFRLALRSINRRRRARTDHMHRMHTQTHTHTHAINLRRCARLVHLSIVIGFKGKLKRARARVSVRVCECGTKPHLDACKFSSPDYKTGDRKLELNSSGTATETKHIKIPGRPGVCVWFCPRARARVQNDRGAAI